MLLDLLVIGLALAAILLIVVYTAITGISPLPTGPAARALVIDSLPPVEQGTIVEAGSGWGGLAFRVARARPRATVIGYELSPLPWLISQLRRLLQPASNLHLYRRDLLRGRFHEVNAVVCYLHADAIADLEPKLRRELPEGALVISNTFRIPGWRPQHVRQARTRFDTPIYVYRMPDAYRPAAVDELL